MYQNENKLKFLGLVKTAALTKHDLDLDIISEELDEPKVKLNRWIKEFKRDDIEAGARELVNIDDLVIDRVLEEIDENIPEFHINPVTGVIEPKPEASKSPEIQHFKDSVTGLKLLNEELQAAAGSIVCQIVEAAQDETRPRELSNLAKALTDIQNAFFNKPTTNIQVNNVSSSGEGGSTLLEQFKNNQKG
jgi:hypothetical protein